MKTVGVIAGNRQLPLILSRNLKRAGHRVAMVAHRGETLEGVSQVADDLLWVKIGQIGKIIKFFQELDIEEIYIVGGINKGVMFTRARPDRKAFKLLMQLKDKGDDAILRAFAEFLEETASMKVQNPLPYLDELVADKGCLTRRRPTSEEKRDVEFGFDILRRIGDFDIGQALVVKDGVVLAVEAMEGTDEMIRRGGRLGREGTVVVKMAKPTQDLRFDQPSVGPDTIFNMILVEAKVLAVEADKTLIFDKEEVVKISNRKGISVIAE
jgi:DUF1009 family protein